MRHDDLPAHAAIGDPTAASLLRDLLDCTELNMDELEEHTRVVIEKARALLERESPTS